MKPGPPCGVAGAVPRNTPARTLMTPPPPPPPPMPQVEPTLKPGPPAPPLATRRAGQLDGVGEHGDAAARATAAGPVEPAAPGRCRDRRRAPLAMTEPVIVDVVALSTTDPPPSLPPLVMRSWLPPGAPASTVSDCAAVVAVRIAAGGEEPVGAAGAAVAGSAALQRDA